MSNIDFRSYSAAFHYSNDDICHFGILGMKWGVRRYQNPDGTLTPAGKRRYNELNAKADYYQTRADNKRHEIFVEGKDTIPRAISADIADAKSKILRKKASKYGTETQEERSKGLEPGDESVIKDFKKDGNEYIKKDDGIDVIIPDDKNKSIAIKDYKDFSKNKEQHEKAIRDSFINQLKKYRDDYVKDARKRGYHDEEAIAANVKYFNDMIKTTSNKAYEYYFSGNGQMDCTFQDNVEDLFAPLLVYDLKTKVGYLVMND